MRQQKFSLSLWVMYALRIAMFCLLSATLQGVAAPKALAGQNQSEQPAEGQTAFAFPPGEPAVAVPMKVIAGQIVVRLDVDGRGIDLLLDSGSSVNLLDPSLMDSLQVVTADRSKPIIISNARVGNTGVNGLTFLIQPFFRQLDAATKAVGILGYGFLRNAVVKIDYDQEKIELIDPEHFDAPKDMAFEIPLDLATRIPLTHVKIGSASGDRFVIDTGATTDVVFANFARAHPSEFSGEHELQDDSNYRYLRHFFPMCGTTYHKPYAVPNILVGSAGVRDWVVFKPDERSCFQSAWDGLIGYDFLRLFTVYFDYPRSRVILVPNALYKNASNTIKQ